MRGIYCFPVKDGSNGSFIFRKLCGECSEFPGVLPVYDAPGQMKQEKSKSQRNRQDTGAQAYSLKLSSVHI